MNSRLALGGKKERPRARRAVSVFLPWEQQGRLYRWSGISRARYVLLALSAVIVFVLFAQRERTESGIRATRASLLTLRTALDSYRAANGGDCPPDLAELERKNFIRLIPLDAWGHPFLLTCPGRFDPQGYELTSAGPDGIPGGLDRVE